MDSTTNGSPTRWRRLTADSAGAIVFAASDASRSMTGDTLFVDGGSKL